MVGSVEIDFGADWICRWSILESKHYSGRELMTLIATINPTRKVVIAFGTVRYWRPIEVRHRHSRMMNREKVSCGFWIPHTTVQLDITTIRNDLTMVCIRRA